MARKRSFGVSTHLYHDRRLGRDHLLEIGSHGFDAVELFATRTHIDYHSTAAVADVQQWLAEAGLELNSVHGPVAERFVGGRFEQPLVLASGNEDERRHALAEAEQALYIARRIPFKVFVVHLGLLRADRLAAVPSTRDAARRSIEALQGLAEPLGVRIAAEIIPNELSQPGSLVHFVENVAETAEIGICLDVGHAHLDGDLVDAIETVSEHLVAVDLHDNHGRSDDHLVPLDGAIEWPAALTTIQKVGYEGTLMLELNAKGSTKNVLVRARDARHQLERLLAL